MGSAAGYGKNALWLGVTAWQGCRFGQAGLWKKWLGWPAVFPRLKLANLGPESLGNFVRPTGCRDHLAAGAERDGGGQSSILRGFEGQSIRGVGRGHLPVPKSRLASCGSQ